MLLMFNQQSKNKDVLFTARNHKDKQQIITFKNLE